MPRRAGRLNAAAGLLLVAGCAGGGFTSERIYAVDIWSAYSPNNFAAFAASGPVVEIRGVPPDESPPEAVVAALRLPGWWPQGAFRLAGPQEIGAGQRIVLSFGVVGAATANGACGPAGAHDARTEVLTVFAVYCRGTRPQSSARLDSRTLRGPSDPGFSAAMTRLFIALAPREDPERERGRDGPPLLFLRGR